MLFVFRFSLAVFRFSSFVYRFSNWGRISNFNIQNLISTFAPRSNIVFWHSQTYFDIRIEAEYRVSVFPFSLFDFRHSNWGGISYFDIRTPILTFELRRNIVVWQNRRNFNIQNHFSTIALRPNIVFWHSKPYFYIRTEAEYRILTFAILFWHSNWGRISNFDNRNPTLTFELSPNFVFWYSKSYFDIRTEAEYRIWTFEILLWHSNWGRIFFDIWNLSLTFELRLNIVFWQSETYFEIRIEAEYRVFVFHFSLFVFRFSTFKLRRNIVFWHSTSYFDIRTEAEYRILTFSIPFWHSNWSRISYFDIRNRILTFELKLNIVFWVSKSYFDIQT